MPTYFNPNQDAVHSRGVVIAPRTTVTTFTNLDLTIASITGREEEDFVIVKNRNDKLFLKFNDDSDWVEITLTPTASPGASAQDIADDINNNSIMIAKGYSDSSPLIATSDNGFLKLEAPQYKPYPAPGSPAPSPWTEPARTSRIYVRPSVAASMLGFPVSEQSPIKETYPTLIKIDDSPSYNPIIATSGVLGGSPITSYVISDIDRAAIIKVICASEGPCTFHINDPGNPGIVIGNHGAPPMTFPADGRVKEIFISGGTAVIEEWQYIQSPINP